MEGEREQLRYFIFLKALSARQSCFEVLGIRTPLRIWVGRVCILGTIGQCLEAFGCPQEQRLLMASAGYGPGLLSIHCTEQPSHIKPSLAPNVSGVEAEEPGDTQTSMESLLRCLIDV